MSSGNVGFQAWLTGNDFPRGKEEVEALELTLQHMAGAGTAAEGLAASLYAPQVSIPHAC